MRQKLLANISITMIYSCVRRSKCIICFINVGLLLTSVRATSIAFYQLVSGVLNAEIPNELRVADGHSLG